MINKLWWGVALLLAACAAPPTPTLIALQAPAQAPAPVVTSSPAYVISTLPPTATPTATLTPTPSGTPPPPSATPSITPTASATLTPSMTPTPGPDTPTPTITPSPTLTPTVDLRQRPPLVERSQWGAREAAYAYPTHTPQRITLHHDGFPYTGTDPAARMRTIQNNAIDQRGWEDVAYHFVVDPQGVIYEGRPVEAVPDTGTEYDPTGHVAITLMGDYSTRQVSPAQVGAIVELVGWLAVAYDLPPETLSGHRDHAATVCPGDRIYVDYLANGLLLDLTRRYIAENFGP